MEINNKQALAITSVDDVARLSKIFFCSKLFSDINSMESAAVKIMAGAELGITPFQSISGVHIIKGKPVMGAGLMASMLDRHPEYDFEVLEQSDKVCSIKFYKNGKAKGTSTFTIKDAEKAGTQNLNKFAANMLYARAMSNGVKWYTPGIFAGPVYVPEEMQEPETVETTYVEVKAPVGPETAQEPQPVQWATQKQKGLIANLLNSHHISEEYRQSVVDIETNYEGELPLPEFERVFQELTDMIAIGTELEKTTPATEEQITDIEIALDNTAFSKEERVKGYDNLKKGYSIAKARSVLKSLENELEKRRVAHAS